MAGSHVNLDSSLGGGGGGGGRGGEGGRGDAEGNAKQAKKVSRDILQSSSR